MKILIKKYWKIILLAFLLVGLYIGLWLFFRPSFYSTYSSPACHSYYICSTYTMLTIHLPYNTPERILDFFSRLPHWSGGNSANFGEWTYSYEIEKNEWNNNCSRICED